MAGTRSGEDDEISEINVTPLVDVVLVLLVIFMITAPTLYQKALEVQLPKAGSGEDPSKTTLSVEITKEGTIRIENKIYSETEFLAKVKSDKPTSAILLGDKKVEHGIVIHLVDLLKENGVQKFSFGVEK